MLPVLEVVVVGVGVGRGLGGRGGGTLLLLLLAPPPVKDAAAALAAPAAAAMAAAAVVGQVEGIFVCVHVISMEVYKCQKTTNELQFYIQRPRLSLAMAP